MANPALPLPAAPFSCLLNFAFPRISVYLVADLISGFPSRVQSRLQELGFVQYPHGSTPGYATIFAC
jgi:hypothetical protein